MTETTAGDYPPILESVFVDLAPNADYIETIVYWDNDNILADWVWCELTYRELEVLTADIANYPYAQVWHDDYWPWTEKPTVYQQIQRGF